MPTSSPTWLRDDGPTLMAVVNLNADSFSDPAGPGVVDHVALARRAVHDGASVVDLGAQSAALSAREVGPDQQCDVLVPIVSRLAGEGVVVSVDTWEPEVVVATLAAGATIANDFSGRADPAMVAAVVEHGAWYVLTHNPVGPRRRQTSPDYYDDVVATVCSFFDHTLSRLAGLGLDPDRVVLDPGVDVAKTPAQTVELLRGADRIRASFGNPILWAVSRKDVIGAITGRRPSQRDPGTLALVGHLADHPSTMLRVHDVAGCVDHLAMLATLHGRREVAPDLHLPDELRRESVQ